jgi:beta-galactosidase
MKNLFLFFIVLTTAVTLTAQKKQNFFKDNELTSVGVYYYPEHWNENQWERDFRNMAAMGFEFTHFAEFAWAQLEPEEGVYNFDWLDKAIDLADQNGLKVILCTPTAAPPVWLVRKYPEVLKMDAEGNRMDHGSRQHGSFSSSIYREYSQKIITELARRYGNDDRVIGWQLDNEPRSNVDYNEDARHRFREWLKEKYYSIDSLNDAWGNAFWSGLYNDFSQINIPIHSQWGMNLHQRLDHIRFCDDETASFLDQQAITIRKYANEKQWITINYIPMYEAGFIGKCNELDFLSYTRYMVYGEHKGIGKEGYRIGEYSRIAMANDYFRPLSDGVYGVMELQPGQVNWGTINSQPLPGAVRLWLWHVFAGGSKFTCSYRYRAPIYGYEQYHYGIVGPDGVTPTQGGKEYQQFIDEIKILRNAKVKKDVPEVYEKRRTAILYNPYNGIAISQNPQTIQWNTEAHILKYYKALKSFGAPVDFVREEDELKNYPVVVVPAYQQISKKLIEKLTAYAENGGHLVLTCRTGHQNPDGHLWEAPFASPIYDLIGAEVECYDLLPPYSPGKVKMNSDTFEWVSWGEILKPAEETESWGTYTESFYEGSSAIVSRRIGDGGTVTYVGVDSKDGNLEKQVLARVFERGGISVNNFPEGVIVEYRDGFGIGLNYSDLVFKLNIPDEAEILIGESVIGPAEVAVWKIQE